MITNRHYPIQMGVNITGLKVKSKKRNASITIDLPEEFAEKLMRQLHNQEEITISNFELAWNDSDYEETQ